jgi:hypothetical protein
MITLAFTAHATLISLYALGSSDVLVDLVNLIDRHSIGMPVIRFKNYKAPRSNTTSGYTYPRKEAKKEGFIKALLRKL